MSRARSSLNPWSWTGDALRLGLWIVPSILGHVFVLGALTLFSMLPSCQDDALDLDDVIEVSLVSLPKSDSRMAQMDVAPPAPPAPVDPKAAAPQEDPGVADIGEVEPTPTTQSDLVVQDKTQTPEPKGDPDRERRDRERREALRRLALQDLDAPTGAEASVASDPDSTSDERIDLGGSGAVTDPELARYAQRVRDLFMSRFNPLPTIAENNPDIEGVLRVRFDLDSGRVTSWDWVSRSGNPSWDGASERAVESVDRVPLPPDRHRDKFVNGYLVRFNAR
ncbi:MAG: hypothetical protein EA397_07495 [Deltaproteobacteria bacterium]|nr:MAG: hypothetical protein EA397_07495 [Deltaproteobacteria bacterium]